MKKMMLPKKKMMGKKKPRKCKSGKKRGKK